MIMEIVGNILNDNDIITITLKQLDMLFYNCDVTYH